MSIMAQDYLKIGKQQVTKILPDSRVIKKSGYMML